MKKKCTISRLVMMLSAILSTCILMAQNTSPYWSLAGNSNATATSKLGTTNATNFVFFTNNAERMRLTSAGLIGIGTTTPIARLTVNSAVGAEPFRALVNGSTKFVVHSGGGVAIGASVVPPANGLYVAGKVAIGTTASSLYSLNVVGSALVSNVLNVGDGGMFSYNGSGTAVFGNGSTYGVYGTSLGGGTGVYGTGSVYGVQGVSTNSTGMYGSGSVGVYGRGTNTGVYGTGSIYGIQANSSTGYGIYSSSTSGIGGNFISSTSHGIWAQTGSATSGIYAGVFQGNVYTYNAYITSDQSLKRNIHAFEDAMSIIEKLQPKNYEFRNDGKYASLNLPKGNHYGLLAQDLEAVLPDLVRDAPLKMTTAQGEQRPTAPLPPGQDMSQAVNRPQETSEVINTKGVNYIELIPIMIKGMQELNAKNSSLQEENNSIKQQLADLQAQVALLKNSRTEPGLDKASGATLRQSIPNPAAGNIAIPYYIPLTVASAKITISNDLGQLIKTISISNKGSNQVNFNSAQLAAGTYYYSLWVEGNKTDTKQLIISR